MASDFSGSEPVTPQPTLPAPSMTEVRRPWMMGGGCDEPFTHAAEYSRLGVVDGEQAVCRQAA